MLMIDSESLEKLKRIEFDILLEVSRICDKHGIEFFLDSGTLLGAARHKGFIPWDDDIDIGMPRDSYQKFLQLAQSELGEGYFLQTRQTDEEAPFSFAKVRKTGTRMVEQAVSGKDVHQGIWIDIFPFDWISGVENDIQKSENTWRFSKRLLNLRVVDCASVKSSAVKRVFRKIARLPILLFPKDAFFNALDKCGIRGKGLSTDRLTCFHYSTVFIALENCDVYPFVELEFEGKRFPVFNNWEKYLELVYGDWKSLPEPDKRRSMHNIAEIDFGDSFS